MGLYDLLALGSGFPRHQWIDREEVTHLVPTLRTDGLLGAFSFFDGQMDDFALGLWAADQARQAGVAVREGIGVCVVDENGGVLTDDGKETLTWLSTSADRGRRSC